MKDSESGLSLAVIEQVLRLGGTLAPRTAPAPLVQTPRGARALPDPLDAWVRGVHWPRRLRFEGQVDEWTLRHVALDVVGPLEEYACASERDYYLIGMYNKGNYYLLVDLDAPGLADPEISRLAHDEFAGSPSGFEGAERLSQFLACLRPMGRAQPR